MQELLSDAIVCLRKREKHVLQVCPQNLVSAHKLSPVALQRVAAVFNNLAESWQAMHCFIDEEMTSPQKVCADEMSEWTRYPYRLSCRQRTGDPSVWLRGVCTQRCSLSHAALVHVDSTTGLVLETLLFVVAKQRPMSALFQRCKHELQLGFSEASDLAAVTRPLVPAEHVIFALAQDFVCDLDLDIDLGEEDWFVLPQLTWQSGCWLTSAGALIPWFTFFEAAGAQDNLAGGCDVVRQQAGKARPYDELPEWARAWFAPPRPSATGSSSLSGSGIAAEAADLTEEQAEEVAVELAEVRALLAEEFPVADLDFGVRVLGGRFTARYRGGRA